ncbi:ATP-binding protein [Streptomyces montanus]|uniref:ATP-binding protein n=1 Tax=Streptomyces montanus TaxID=2580423 RepID=UPI001FE815B2|nr:ATP-binding protein [Streptomyces montanus]
MHPLSEPTLAPLSLPEPALYVLIGPGGSGKSTVATCFPAEWRLSLDDCRARVADDPGAQEATPDAVTLFLLALDARLKRRKPTVVDATNTEQAHRTGLVRQAQRHEIPAVAIVLRTPLEICKDRQQDRPANRQVPDPALIQQFEGTPSPEHLVGEGFTSAHYADELDLLGLLLRRSATADRDPLADIRYAFGDDLAATFSWHDERPRDFATGAFRIASREIFVRWMDDADPYDHHWQAQFDGACINGCPRPLWVKVTNATDLRSVYAGAAPDELWCDGCGGPGLAIG